MELIEKKEIPESQEILQATMDYESLFNLADSL